VEDQQALSPEVKQNYAYAYFRLGYAAYQKNETDLAIDYLKEAIRINPDIVGPHYWLGRLYYEIGELEQARQSWQQVIRIDPGYQRAQYFLKKTNGAIRYGKQAYEHYEAGYNYYEQGLYQQALAEYQQAIQYNNNFTDAYYLIGAKHYYLRTK
jgi:tetratricopeptide (TPR) repeat protein